MNRHAFRSISADTGEAHGDAVAVHGAAAPSDARTTSVGSLAIDRFLRPVCYQNLPLELLPSELRDGLRDGAAERLPRLVDGRPG